MRDSQLADKVREATDALNNAISEAETSGLYVGIRVLDVNNIEKASPSPVVVSEIQRPL